MPSDIKTIDPKVMEAIRRNAELKGKTDEEATTSAPTDKSAAVKLEEAYLSATLTPVCDANRVLFSTLFWKPKHVPDFPVPKYEAEDWDEAVRERIPTSDDAYHLDHKIIEQTVYSMYAGGTTLLHGETGTGKTSVLQEICARLTIPFMRVSCHGQMEQSEFTGANSVVNDGGVPITKHSDTDVTLACKHGGMVCLDEAFRTPPTALMSIQSLLEFPHTLNLQDSHGNARQLKVPQDRFWLFLTDNTTGVGDTTGNFTAEVQDTSTRNRIRRAIYVGYMKPAQEIRLLHKQYPDIPKTFLENMVKVATLVRAAFKNGSSMETMSIRELLTWCKDFENTRSMEMSFKLGIFSRLTPDDKVVIRDIYKQVFGITLKSN